MIGCTRSGLVLSPIALTCAALICVCANSRPSAAQSVKVDWTGERLSVVAVDAPLAGVLTEVARKTGIGVVGLRHLSGTARIEIRDNTLLQALRALLADTNYVIVDRDPARVDAASRVVVWLHVPRERSAVDSCAAPATVTRSPVL